MKELPKPITVGELIAKLREWPDETPVMIDGYEWGMDYPMAIELANVKRESDDEEATYGGRFGSRYPTNTEDAFLVVYISR